MRRLALFDLTNIFWTIPPEMQYYVLISILVVMFKLREAADFRIGPGYKVRTLLFTRRAYSEGSGCVFLRACHMFRACWNCLIHSSNNFRLFGTDGSLQS
jgi:hypothetical protein